MASSDTNDLIFVYIYYQVHEEGVRIDTNVRRRGKNLFMKVFMSSSLI